MKIRSYLLLMGGASLLWSLGTAQTPEETKAWEVQKAQAQAEARLRAERLQHERDARRADPMSWVKTLDPMSAGGWEFRTVAPDGTWAAFSTLHQLKREKKHLVTMWLRQEYPETQHTQEGDAYMSYVEKVQYDCEKAQLKPLMVIYYTRNNLEGGEQSQQNDSKHTAWSPVVPGTQIETLYHYACAQP